MSTDSEAQVRRVRHHLMVRPRQPPSQRVEQALRVRIEAGEWAAGDQLPSVAALAEEYGVARATVVTAQRRIEADGLIEIVANWGVFRR